MSLEAESTGTVSALASIERVSAEALCSDMSLGAPPPSGDSIQPIYSIEEYPSDVLLGRPMLFSAKRGAGARARKAKRERELLSMGRPPSVAAQKLDPVKTEWRDDFDSMNVFPGNHILPQSVTVPLKEYGELKSPAGRRLLLQSPASHARLGDDKTSTIRLHETFSSSTGQRQISLAAAAHRCDLGSTVPTIHHPPPNWSLDAANKTKSVKEMREDYYAFLNESFIDSRNSERRRNKHQRQRAQVNILWERLLELYGHIAREAFRFERPLKLAYTAKAPSTSVQKDFFIRVFLNNYAFHADERKSVTSILGGVFDALDEDLDGWVDWREFVARMYVLEMPKVAAASKCKWCYDLFSEGDGYISLHTFGRIVRIAALDREVDAVELLLRSCLYDMGITIDYRDVAVASAYRVDSQLFNKMLRRKIRALEGGDGIGDMPGNAVMHQDPTLTLLSMIAAHMWDRTPDKTRLRVVRDMQENARRKFEIVNKRLRWSQARLFWQRYVVPGVLRSRLEVWKAYVASRRRKHAGEKHFRHRSWRAALLQWEFRVDSRIERRLHWKSACKYCDDLLTKHAFAAYADYYRRAKKKFEHDCANARFLFETIKKEQAIAMWKNHVSNILLMKKAIRFMQGSSKREWFTIWSTNAKLIKEHRQAENRRGEIRQAVMEAEIQEEIERVREEERRLEEERKAEEERKRLEDEENARQEAIWEARRRAAFDDIERRRLLKAQEDAREASKSKKARIARKDFKSNWDDIEKKAVESARHEAEQFLKTSDGKEMMQIEVTRLQEDAEMMQKTKSKGAETQEGSSWKKFYDPVFQDYFFYDEETGEKVSAKGLAPDEALKIAEANYVASQVEQARSEVHRLRAREKARAEREAAAQKLQAMFHTWKSRKFIRDLIGLVFVKRKHAYSSAYYYHNTRTRKMQWQKPVNMGSYDLPVPVWNVRCADGSASAFEPGSWYYENRKSPWLSSKDKPPGILPCASCQFQLASLTCEECAMPYCLDCYEASHPVDSEYASHTCTRRPVEVAHCVVCKTKIATKVCKHCKYDAFCSLHFKMVHAPAKRKNHTSYDV